jgi:hypothetical protein
VGAEPPAPIQFYAAIFFLGVGAFLVGVFLAGLSAVGFAFLAGDFCGGGGTKAASAWARKSISVSRGIPLTACFDEVRD